MPRTDRRTIRTKSVIPDMTRDYTGAGKPKPHSMASAKRAARTHFKATPGTQGAWRGWTNVKTSTGKFLVCLQIERAGRGRAIGKVSVFGTVDETGR